LQSSGSATAIVLLAACVGACHAPRGERSVHVIDLLKELPRAERLPDPAAFGVVEQTIGGVSRPAVAIPIPARVVWTLRFPERATFNALVAVDGAPSTLVVFRVGVSDERRYDALARVELASAPPQWIPLAADLSVYAGRKWSVFYRPDAHPWRLVLSIDGVGGAARAICAEPSVDSDREAARAYATRRR
jgi:hypothetical protein